MDLVAEVHEIGQVVDARPLDRLLVAIAGAHRFEHRRVRPDLRVAVHAGLRWRDPGKARSLNRGMAIAAVDAFSPNVMGVAERDGLFGAYSLLGHPRRTLQAIQTETQSPQQDHQKREAHFGVSIRAMRKKLSHLP